MKYLLSLSCLVFVLGVILMPVAVIGGEAQAAPENNQINATGTPSIVNPAKVTSSPTSPTHTVPER
ncbi:MAG: hypothetical protein ABSE07_09765 [Methanoregula sp.]